MGQYNEERRTDLAPCSTHGHNYRVLCSECSPMIRQIWRERETQKHLNRTPNACAMPRDEHICSRPDGHVGEHHCACGETWTQHEDDNALLTHPADTKKKPERVRGFQI